jgi:hypothetical protein
VKIKLFVNDPGADSARNIKSGLETPDVWRATTYQLPEYVATGNSEPLDTYIARDGVDKNDWLLPLDAGKVDGHITVCFRIFASRC